jgi:hypothetical protein
MNANQIIDNIADNLGYSREGFKDVVPTLTRFDALLQTLDLSPEEIREARNAYSTYIATQKTNVSTATSTEDSDDDENALQNLQPKDDTKPTDDLSDVLNSLNDTDESADLSGARPIDQDEDMDGDASPQPNPDNDDVFNEEAMRGQVQGQGQGQGGDGDGEGDGDGDGDGDGGDGEDGEDGEDGDGDEGDGEDGDGEDGDGEDGEDGDGEDGDGEDGDGEDGDGEDGDGEDGEDGDGDEGEDGDGDDEDDDEDEDDNQPPPPPKQKKSPDEQRTDELQKIIDEAVRRKDAATDDTEKISFDRIIDNATSLKTKIETAPCQSQVVLPFYLREFWEQIAKPTLYELFSVKRYDFDLAYFPYDEDSIEFFKNAQKKISSIAINSYSNCAAEYAMTYGKSNMLPFYLSRKNIEIKVFGASFFSNQKDAFRPIISLMQNEEIQGENNTYNIFEFAKKIRPESNALLNKFTENFTNTKAIKQVQVLTEIDFRKDVLTKELNQIFTIKYTDIDDLSDLMRLTRGYTNLNDAFLTYEKYALECNKIILFILAYDFYLTKNQIKLV